MWAGGPPTFNPGLLVAAPPGLETEKSASVSSVLKSRPEYGVAMQGDRSLIVVGRWRTNHNAIVIYGDRGAELLHARNGVNP